MNLGMIRFMHKNFILFFALFFSFNSFARENTLLNSDWKFKSGESINAEAIDFDNFGWQAISIPRNWGWEEA